MARKNSGPKFPHLVLFIGFDHPEHHDGSAHVRGWLGLVDRTLYSSDVGGKYKGVCFTAQGSENSLAHGRNGPLYGYRLQWEGDDSGLSELKKGVTALADLERKMDAAGFQYGPPASFGAWVQRLATVIGLGKVKLPHLDYCVTPVDGAWRIDQQVREWQAAVQARDGLDENGRPIISQAG